MSKGALRYYVANPLEFSLQAYDRLAYTPGWTMDLEALCEALLDFQDLPEEYHKDSRQTLINILCGLYKKDGARILNSIGENQKHEHT